MKINAITILLVGMLSLIIGAPKICSMPTSWNTPVIDSKETCIASLKAIINENMSASTKVGCPYLPEDVCSCKLTNYKTLLCNINRTRAEELLSVINAEKSYLPNSILHSTITQDQLPRYLDEFARNSKYYLPEIMREVLGTDTLNEFNNQKYKEDRIMDAICKYIEMA